MKRKPKKSKQPVSNVMVTVAFGNVTVSPANATITFSSGGTYHP